MVLPPQIGADQSDRYSFYLRNMHHENRLAIPEGISLVGVPIDLRRIETPTFVLSTREDHVAPWQSTHAATQLYQGPIKSAAPLISPRGRVRKGSTGYLDPPAGRLTEAAVACGVA
jgi:polyhydroxyalkanoate synthase